MIEFLNRSQDQMLASPTALLQQQSGKHTPAKMDFKMDLKALAGGGFQ
jgi:hypothetical protein